MAAIQFTTLIRLPFVRGDFVDPPQADWSAAKDRALWKVISKSSKTSDLNWVELATRFQVPSAFLLQQAAWLYERHLDHVRTQMKKVGSANAPGTSGCGSAHTTIGGVPMQRGGSGGSRASRAPSALSIRPKDSPVPRGETSTPITATAPPLSRTPSTTTITQSRAHAQQAVIRPQLRPAPPNATGTKRSDQASATAPSKGNQDEALDTDSPGIAGSSSSSSSSSDSDAENPAHRSQLFKRPPRFRQQRPRELVTYDEGLDGEDDPEHSASALLPFARTPEGTAARIGDVEKGASSTNKRQQAPPHNRQRIMRGVDMRREEAAKPHALDVSSSLASSASDIPKVSTTGPGPISPKHRTELAKLSPRRSGLKSRREGSEGTPSMGSSFSDIDDAGISQSALEEALLSNIQHGRMSTLSQLRSRYL